SSPPKTPKSSRENSTKWRVPLLLLPQPKVPLPPIPEPVARRPHPVHVFQIPPKGDHPPARLLRPAPPLAHLQLLLLSVFQERGPRPPKVRHRRPLLRTTRPKR